jgi:ribosome-associated protein
MQAIMAESIRVTSRISIPLDEILVRVSRSSGPGGQHANTSETRVEVSFDVTASSLSEMHKRRLTERLGDTVRAVSQDSRSQARNRELALARLAERLAEGLRVERRRVGTRPTKASVERRLESKRRRANVKRTRGAGSGDADR